MDICKKIKEKIKKFINRKQIDFMWKSKEIEQIEQKDKDLGEIYSKNIMWIKLGNNPLFPYYFVEENGNKYAKIPYIEIDLHQYITNGNLIVNKFMNVKN